MRGQLDRLLLLAHDEVLDRLSFAGPVLVHVLPKGVDEGKEMFLLRGQRGLGRAAGGNIADLETVILRRLDDKDGQAGHLGQVERLDGDLRRRQTHFRQLGAKFGGKSPRQGHAEGSGRSRRHFDAVRHVVRRAAGGGILDAAIDAKAVLPDVLYVHGHVGEARQIPAAVGGLENDPGLLRLVSGGEPQDAAVEAKFHIVGLDRGEVEVVAEFDEHLVGDVPSRGRNRPRERHRAALVAGTWWICFLSKGLPL